MSDTYEAFADLYDTLMEDAPYSKWLEMVKATLPLEGGESKKNRLLELGSGTGTLALSLLKAGYSLTVSDYSSEMLTVAEQKIRREGYDRASFYLLDMSEFDLETLYDGVLIFCDALNYLPDELAINQTFQNVYQHLEDGGYFLFDVHSTKKMALFLNDTTYGSSDEAISYLWECFEGEAPYSVSHDLTFFIQQDNGLYARVEETHEQRTYSLSTYRSLLESNGFHIKTILGDFHTPVDLEEAERWIFIAQKI